jgi:hypothetical protein
VRSTPKMPIHDPPRFTREGKSYPQVGALTSDVTSDTVTRTEFSVATPRWKRGLPNEGLCHIITRRYVQDANSWRRKHRGAAARCCSGTFEAGGDPQDAKPTAPGKDSCD